MNSLRVNVSNNGGSEPSSHSLPWGALLYFDYLTCFNAVSQRWRILIWRREYCVLAVYCVPHGTCRDMWEGHAMWGGGQRWVHEVTMDESRVRVLINGMSCMRTENTGEDNPGSHEKWESWACNDAPRNKGKTMLIPRRTRQLLFITLKSLHLKVGRGEHTPAVHNYIPTPQ